MFGLFKRRRNDTSQQSRRSRNVELFGERLREHGVAPLQGAHSGTQTCGAAAGLFAYLVNGKERIDPGSRLTDHELAVLWLGFISADAATQMTDEQFELAVLAMLPMVIAANSLPRMMELLDEVVRLQETLIVKAPNEFGATIAATFVEWALKKEERGLPVLARNLPDLAETLASYRVR